MIYRRTLQKAEAALVALQKAHERLLKIVNELGVEIEELRPIDDRKERVKHLLKVLEK